MSRGTPRMYVTKFSIATRHCAGRQSHGSVRNRRLFVVVVVATAGVRVPISHGLVVFPSPPRPNHIVDIEYCSSVFTRTLGDNRISNRVPSHMAYSFY